MITITCTRITNVFKKYSFIVSVHTGGRWVKPAWKAEPIFIALMLLTGALPGDTGYSIPQSAILRMSVCFNSSKTTDVLRLILVQLITFELSVIRDS